MDGGYPCSSDVRSRFIAYNGRWLVFVLSAHNAASWSYTMQLQNWQSPAFDISWSGLTVHATYTNIYREMGVDVLY